MKRKVMIILTNSEIDNVHYNIPYFSLNTISILSLSSLLFTTYCHFVINSFPFLFHGYSNRERSPIIIDFSQKGNTEEKLSQIVNIFIP